MHTAEQQRPFKHKYLHLLCTWVTDIILPPGVYHQYANPDTIKKEGRSIYIYGIADVYLDLF